MPIWLTPLLGFLGPILDRFLPDKSKQAELLAQIQMAALQQEGQILDAQLKVALAQAQVNQQEASNPSLFVAGARPGILWICAAALLWQYLLRPMIAAGFAIAHQSLPPLPGIDDELWQLMLGMLGLGALRTYDKVKGVDTKGVS